MSATSTDLSFFYVVLGTDIFVDKTLMISKVLQLPENILITCPRKFGKSTNLDMLRRFFSVGVYQSSKFQSTKIYKDTDVMKHAGMYAVVWIDLSWFTVSITSLEKSKDALRGIIHRTYFQYKFLCTSPNYFKMFSLLVKTEKSEPLPFVFKTIFTGVAAVTCTGPSPLNNMEKYSFLENIQFVDYYGILLTEFEELLEKPAFSNLRNERDDAISFYNGYEYGKRKILCTYSVRCYLDNSEDRNRLRSHWCNSGAVRGFSSVWEREEMQPLLEDIINGDSLRVEKIDKIEPRHLICLRRIFQSTCQSILSDVDILLMYLQQLGYFGIVCRDEEQVTMCVPNEEIRSEFKAIFRKCFKSKYKCTDIILDRCAKHLDRLVNISIEDDINDVFEKFKEQLGKACRECLVREFLNEAALEHLVFAILLKTIFFPVSQVRVIDLPNNRKANKLDLCFYKNDFGIVGECKFVQRESVESAINQIKDRKYDDIFLSGRIENIKKHVFLVSI